MDSDYKFDSSFQVSPEVIDDFDNNGYIILRGFLSTDELKHIQTAIEHKDGVTKHAYENDDGGDRKTRMCLWGHPGNDVTGMLARCEKLVDTSEKLLGGEVYHYHTKLMMKEPYTGGQFVWHQDYGYWYKNGILFPDLLTAFIAIDKADKTNGCLQVLKGSHRCGRVDHILVGGQTGADLERVKQIKNVLPLLHVELQPGDALLFHSNLLHKSEANTSEFRRWAFLTAFCKRSNNPTLPHHHPFYTPLEKVPNKAILECTNITDLYEKDFLNPSDDNTIVYEQK
ncbi:unnamed protein product [Owenia fusiformis]|uniref:Uncharacterized protein n=1 Tax=Owenia fusiformis TaxID=6347 RepID=A0A8J1Y3S7_OWEFU|nr:unnamed protein product [Owenia fusiformis]